MLDELNIQHSTLNTPNNRNLTFNSQHLTFKKKHLNSQHLTFNIKKNKFRGWVKPLWVVYIIERT